MDIQTKVYNPKPEFNSTLQKTINYIVEGEEKIAQGLAVRLVKYALKSLNDGGFKDAIAGWDVEVYTTRGDCTPSERVYCVRWKNSDNGYIEVIGIYTQKGWPFLDHGYAIGID